VNKRPIIFQGDFTLIVVQRQEVDTGGRTSTEDQALNFRESLLAAQSQSLRRNRETADWTTFAGIESVSRNDRTKNHAVLLFFGKKSAQP
jgi:hypothetical protein